MAVPFSNTKLRVPKGFQNILEGLAREVLRNQPANSFEFGAKYFEQLLRDRAETGHDPAVHGARQEDRFYNNDSFKSPSVDPSSPQQQDAALKIQTNYRKHAAEQEVAVMKEEEAAEKIQAGFRGFQDRQQFEEMKGEEKKEEEEEVDIDLNDPDVEKAAVKIQAGFKGFKARQEIKDLKDKSDTPKSPEAAPTAEEEEVDIDLNDPEVNAAALKIQAGFKGHKARKQIKEHKERQTEDTKQETQEEKAEPQTETEAKEPQTEIKLIEPQTETEAQEPETVEKRAEEEVDIDLDDPEVAQAALKIQTGFRGHKARQEVQALKDARQLEEKIGEKKADEEEVDIDLNDPDVENAALKIQAGFKGMQARQEIKAMKDAKDQETDTKTEEQDEEIVDIDLNDPETEKAALKIQAGFKGFQTRKEIKAKMEGQTKDTKEEVNEESTAEKTEEVDIDLTDPEVEKAATKIQAGFKGFKTRQEMKAKTESGTDTKAGDETEQSAEKTEEKSEEKTEETQEAEKAEG